MRHNCAETGGAGATTRPHESLHEKENSNGDDEEGEGEGEGELNEERADADTILTGRVEPGKKSTPDDDGSDAVSQASMNEDEEHPTDLEPLPYVEELQLQEKSSPSPLEGERLLWEDLGRSDSPQRGRIGTVFLENYLGTGAHKRPNSCCSGGSEECSKNIKAELDDLLDIDCDGGIWDSNEELVRMPSPNTMGFPVAGWSSYPILSGDDDSGDGSTVLDTLELDDLFSAAEMDVDVPRGVDEWAESGHESQPDAGNERCEELNAIPTPMKILPPENVVDTLSQQVRESTITNRR